MCFENGSDNLYPNPLIGSQYGLQWTYKAAGWRELRTEKKLLRGTIYTWVLSVLFTTLRGLSSKSLAVKVPMLKALPITVYPKEMYFRTVFEDFPFAWKKGLGKTVTCELIKSQRPFSSWMAFPLWHERGSLEAPSRRWPWRLGKCSLSDQTGLFSGVRTTLESAVIEQSRFAAVDQYFNRPH